AGGAHAGSRQRADFPRRRGARPARRPERAVQRGQGGAGGSVRAALPDRIAQAHRRQHLARRPQGRPRPHERAQDDRAARNSQSARLVGGGRSPTETIRSVRGRAEPDRAYPVRAREGGARPSLRGALQLAIASRRRQLATLRELDRVLFVVGNLLDALCPAAVLRRPPRLSLAVAKEETVRAILAYLRS